MIVTAEDLGRVNPDSTAFQHLFRLSEMVAHDTSWDDEPELVRFGYVVVSAATGPDSGPETYVFPAKPDGTIKSWLELPGSTRGVLDHQVAIDAFLAEVNATDDRIVRL